MTRIAWKATDGVTAVLGVWALWSWIGVFTGMSFDGIRWGLPVVALGLLGVFAAGPPETPVQAGPSPSGFVWTWVVATLLWFGWWMGVVPLVVPGLASVVVLAPWARGAPYRHPFTLDRRQALGLLAIGVLVSAVVLCAHRPDVDDAYYLNAVWFHLQRPELPALAFDGMHGLEGVPIQQLIHRPQTFELLAAAVGTLVGAEASYYTVLPVFFAFLGVWSTGLVLTRITPRTVVLGTLVFAVVLVAWSGGHRSYGNFGWVRLYQGKGVFVATMVPLVIHHGLAFVDAPRPSRWLLLLAAVCMAATTTSSALVLTPVLVVTLLLGAVRWDVRGLGRALAGTSALLPLGVVLTRVQWELSQAAPLVTEGTVLGFDAVTGTGTRALVAMAAVLTVPMLLRRADNPSGPWIARWMVVCFALVLNGLTAPVLAQKVALLSWRLYWAVPLPLWVALFGVLGLSLVRTDRRVGAAVSVGFAVFLIRGTWTIDPTNGVHFALGGPKRFETEWALADLAIEMNPEGAEMLATSRVAMSMTGHPDRPRMAVVRDFYTKNLARHWGHAESVEREHLRMLADGVLPPKQVEAVFEAVERRCIRVIVVSETFRKKGFLRQEMLGAGFRRVRVEDHYEIWKNHTSCER